MGFTNVAWESRSTEQLARDLTEGAGPTSVGAAGAAWVRVADELASVSADYDGIVEKIKGAFVSAGGDAAARKLDQFGQWLQAASLSAAGNGERAEEAAVAYSVAVTTMPSVSHAVAVKTTQEVMSSLAAYNGAILNGQFAEFDEQASGLDATASAAMYQYEDACAALGTPWEQPLPPDVSNGAALQAERHAQAAVDASRENSLGRVGGSGAAVAPVPVVLASFRPNGVKSSEGVHALQQVRATAAGSPASGVGPMGGGYGPMGALGRADNSREYQSSLPAASLDDGGETGASLSDSGVPWLPAAQQSDTPFLVSEVSWGPNTSVFDELAAPDGLEALPYADDPERALEQISNQWVSPPVIGVDKELTL
jgi:PPE-repeat protein